MNHHFTLPHRYALGGRRFGRGFTLIELMVAMLLGLIITAGVVSVLLANFRSYRTNTALSNVQAKSRIAFELMAREIRQAGLTGCDSQNGRIANVLVGGPNDGGTLGAWWADYSNAVHGYGGSENDPGVTEGSTEGERVAGTDSLQLIGASGLALSVEDHNPGSAQLKLNASTTNLQDGDIIIICDPDHAAVVQISNYNSANVTLVHNAGGSESPGNCSKGLGFPTDCGTTNGNPYEFGDNSSISALAAHDWYIGVSPDGRRSLYRAALNGGTGGTTAQEMVRGVSDMQIVYHDDTATSYVPATSITDWSDVDAARVTLTMESAKQRVGTDQQPLTRVFTFTTAIRNRVD